MWLGGGGRSPRYGTYQKQELLDYYFLGQSHKNLTSQKSRNLIDKKVNRVLFVEIVLKSIIPSISVASLAILAQIGHPPPQPHSLLTFLEKYTVSLFRDIFPNKTGYLV